jgi:UPF0716 family protein affecting phage T7 exclusion
MLIRTAQIILRVLKVLAGFVLILGGLIMLVTPGPGLVTIAAGLFLLAAEFAWARHLLHMLKEQGVKVKDAVFSGNGNKAAGEAPK